MNLIEEFFPGRHATFIPLVKRGEVSWRCPSNIALVKYWGKYPGQLPCNPSISLTLNNAYTETKVSYEWTEQGSVDFLFDGELIISFGKRIERFIEKLSEYFPFLSHLNLEINSTNSFPHSAGIASSASAMGALSLCICSIEEQLTGQKMYEEAFYRKVAFIARLGSGSATRSIYGGLVLWGKLHEVHGSSDFYGIELHNYSIVTSLNDAILIVDSSEKVISSTEGHALMNDNPYASVRFEQGRKHCVDLLNLFKDENIMGLCDLIESEALALHSMMMTSTPGYLLLLPTTVEIIIKIRSFRAASNVPVCFTLDAGPNVHLLYPKAFKEQVVHFINNELLQFCENNKWLDDEVGLGPVLLNETNSNE
jgi:diphosphomevalonate decarboxylase